MSDSPTCGKGLAAHATTPAAVSDFFSAMANVLDEHRQALDLTDDAARPEHEAYLTLTHELRGIATQLADTARRMAGYRDLPMGRHDERKMSGRESIAAFEHLVRTERTLVALLNDTVSEHQVMLGSTR